MLVLTRKQQEVIKIGDSITVTILRVQGQSVRVGIDAPQEVRIVRGELTPTPPPELKGEAVDDSGEGQVIEFRFSSDPKPELVEKATRSRGPLASLMATLHTTGIAISK